MIQGDPIIVSGGGASSPRLPAGYQEVEYIETDGTAYIDTGYVFSGTARLQIKAYRPNATLWYLFGAAEDSGKKRFMLGSTGNSNMVLYGSAASTYAGTTVSYVGEIADARNRLFEYKGTSLDGRTALMDLTNVYCSTSGSSVGTPLTVPSYYLAENYNGTVRCNPGTRGCELIIWDGPQYDLVRHIVSCVRLSDGAVGAYDLANDVFYTNAAASGTLTAGPVVNA